MAAKYRVNRSAQGLGAVDREQPLLVWMHAAHHQICQQFLRQGGVFRGAFADRQHVLVALRIHAHRPDRDMVPERHAVADNCHTA